MEIAIVLEWVFWAVGLREPPLSTTKLRFSGMIRYFCIDKAKRRLGYTPLVSLDDASIGGVEDSIQRQEAKRDILAQGAKSKQL